MRHAHRDARRRGERAGARLRARPAAALAASPDAPSTLAALIEAAVELARADSAKVFLLDGAGDRFWLRASTADNAHWVGRYSFEVGHGLTSWTLLNRASAALHEDPEDDPRYFVDPDLGCVDYQSVATIPLPAPSGRVLGALMLDARRPHAFTPEVVAAVEPLCVLAAAGVEAADGRADADRVAAALTRLAAPLEPAADEQPTRLLLGACEAARLAAGAAAALIAVREGGAWRTACVAAPEAHVDVLEQLPAAALLDGLAQRAGLQLLSRDERGELLGGLGASRLADLPALVVADAGVLVLACLGCAGSPAPLAREAILTATRTAALLLQRRRLAEQASAGSAEAALLEALRAGDETAAVLRVRARRLGIDLSAAHLAAVVESGDEGALAGIVGDVRSCLPGAAGAVRGSGALLLLPAEPDPVPELERLLAPTTAAAGVAAARAGYASAFADAAQAARIGRVLGGPRVTRAEDLGAQRHLYRLAQEPASDVLELRLEALRERDPELFETVEQLVEANGNRVSAAARLHVHRNTLRQRLARIQRSTGIDAGDPARQFDLQMALRLLRFRRLLREVLTTRRRSPEHVEARRAPRREERRQHPDDDRHEHEHDQRADGHHERQPLIDRPFVIT